MEQKSFQLGSQVRIKPVSILSYYYVENANEIGTIINVFMWRGSLGGLYETARVQFNNHFRDIFLTELELVSIFGNDCYETI